MRSAILSMLLILVSAVAHAAPLTLGAVRDHNESVTEPNTDRRCRSIAGEAEQALGQPVRLQYFKRGFSAIRPAKEGTLDLVFGPAHVVANISNFKFEPILKTRETTSTQFVAGPNYKGSLFAKLSARVGVPDYGSLMGGMARCGINNCGLAKSDFAEIEFHRIPEASLYGLEIGRYGVRVQEEYGHGHVPGSMIL